MSIKNKFLFIAIFLPLSYSGVVFAEDLEQTCAQISNNTFIQQNMTGSDYKKLLDRCVQFYDDKSKSITEDLTKTAGEKKTLQSQITILKKKVQNLEYQIKQGSIVIKDLTLQIGETKTSIDKITLQIQESQYQISSILRSIAEEDEKSSVEILLEGDLSDFFGNIVRLEGLNSKLRSLLANTKDLKIYLEDQKVQMDDEKSQTEKTVKLQSLQKQAAADNKKQQESLAVLKEAQYQEQLQQQQDVQKKASEIRARLFELVGVSKAPNFGEAYAIAKYVSNITGVRPALLLAVLKQESGLGMNTGQCYLSNTKTGAGKSKKNNATISRVMNPTTNVPYFLTITSSLGMDTFTTAVSCPMSYGWGGAMGPAQFMPSTWANPKNSVTGVSFSDRIKTITGKAPNPWNITDAFLAAGLYLSDYGAKSRNEDNEWRAAMIYFSGSTNTKFRFYGDNVISIARGFELDIAAISEN